MSLSGYRNGVIPSREDGEESPASKRSVPGRTRSLALCGARDDTCEKLRRRLVRLDPRTMQQEVVHLVRKDEQLDVDPPLPQLLGEMNGLVERDVAIVVALNQQHW